MRTARHWPLLVLVLALPALALRPDAAAVARPAITLRFDHTTTGFELDGAHRDLPCESCHLDAVFKGTPRACTSCHSRGTRYNATPKSAGHILSSDRCDACHTSTAFLPAVHFEHAEVRGSCASCHDGVHAAGRPPGHIQTSEPCETCHSTVTWLPAAFYHAGITSGCVSCHNGQRATGKGTTHLATTDRCEACHGTNYWQPALRVDHAQVAGSCVSCHSGSVSISTGVVTGKSAHHIPADNNCGTCHVSTSTWTQVSFTHTGLATACVSCHNGTTATGRTPTHMATTDACGSCHGVVSWKPADRVDHTQVTGTCSSCHSGTVPISTGVITGKPTGHIVTSQECDACHTTIAWKPANFNHNGVTGNCFSCHNGTIATGKTATHLATSNVCESCHGTTVWKPATKVDHTQVTGSCYACHSGAVTISTGVVAGKPANHIATNNACENCHTTNAWKPATFDHAGVAPGTCSTCHNGVQATGKPTSHVVTTAQCDTCHSTLAWKPIHFSHAGVTSGCAGCHDGIAATGKPADHFVTRRDCVECHNSTAWTPVVHMHVSANYPGDHRAALGCTNSACHGGNSDAVTWRTPSYANSCAGCHASDFRADKHSKYGSTRYTVSELRNCSGACHTYSDATLMTITKRRSGPQHRVTDSGFN